MDEAIRKGYQCGACHGEAVRLVLEKPTMLVVGLGSPHKPCGARIAVASMRQPITIEGDRYELIGVVMHNKQRSHYVAEVKFGEQWHFYDDLARTTTLRAEACLRNHGGEGPGTAHPAYALQLVYLKQSAMASQNRATRRSTATRTAPTATAPAKTEAVTAVRNQKLATRRRRSVGGAGDTRAEEGAEKADVHGDGRKEGRGEERRKGRGRVQGGGPEREEMGAISMLCANMRGVSGKVSQMRESMRKGGDVLDDVVGVVETWLRIGEGVEEIENYEWEDERRAVPPGKRGSGGVGVWMRAGRSMTVVERNERMMWVRLPAAGMRTTFVAFVYAPPQTTEWAEVQAFWQALGDRTREWATKGDVVVMGDLNARVGDAVGDAECNRHGRLMLDYCEENDMRILNSEWAHGEKTWSDQHDREVSTIDYVLVAASAIDRVVSMSVTDHDFGSDHRPVRLRWRLNLAAQGPPRVHRRWKLPRTEEGKAKYVAAAEKAMEAWRSREIGNRHNDWGDARVRRVWRTWKHALNTVAMETMGKTTERRTRHAWDEEVGAWLDG